VKEQNHEPCQDHVGDQPGEDRSERPSPCSCLEPVLEVLDRAKESRERHVLGEYEREDARHDEPEQPEQAGNLLSRTYPNGLKTAYGYDSADQLATATVNGKKTYYTHDANGKLASTVFSNGILETRSYDAAGQLKDISAKTSDGKPFYSRSYSYDAVGNPTQLIAKSPRKHSDSWWGKLFGRKGEALASWKETYSYDSRDRLLKACMNESCSRFFSYSYDPVGNRISQKTRKATTSYAYDAADELLSESSGKHDLTLYSYDALGNLASTLHPSGILDSRSYDAAGRVTDISGKTKDGKPFYSRSYTYDPVGNPLTLTATSARNHAFSWWGDKDKTLSRWTETYSYDSRGCLTQAPDGIVLRVR